MAKQVTFDVAEALARLKASMEDIAPRLEDEINQAVKDAAHAAYASIAGKAQSKLKSTRQDYLKALQFTELGDNEFLITLNGKLANDLEEGFPAYDLVPGMLKSNKTVTTGKRAGQPWVQETKPKGENGEKHKFAHVPFEHKPFSKEGDTNMADAIKSLTALNLSGKDQKITQIFKAPDGSPMEGKVAVMLPPKTLSQAHKTMALGYTDNPMLQGLVKYQKVQKSESGKESVQSIYVSYRTVSEKGKPWIHKGFGGVKAFDDAEKELLKQIDQILKVLL